jgi:hypothetical protein
MANTIKATNYTATEFVTTTSRYAGSVVWYYGDNRLITFETYKRTSYPNDPKDIYAIVSPGWEYRPDKASMDIYSTPDFWWKILEANNISDIYDFKSGLNIRIPANPF